MMEVMAADKKGTMVAVKNTLLLIFIFITQNCVAQQAIPGTYIATEGDFTFAFSDSTFESTSYINHGNAKRIAGGDYHVAEDTLILNFRPLEDPTPSTFTFIKREQNLIPPGKDSTARDTVDFSVQFKVTNTRGEPLPLASLSLRNEDLSSEPVMGFGPDSLGRFPRLNIYNKFIKKFHITFLGHESLEIYADTLAGYISTVQVKLSDANTYYSDEAGTSKFFIEQWTGKKLILTHLGSGRRSVFNKKETEN